MVTKADRKYLNQLKHRYQKVRKLQKKIILDEFTKTLGYDRKHAIKLLNGKYRYITRLIHKSHRIYTREDADTLEQVCELLGWICSKRIKPQLELAVDELIKAGKLILSEQDRKRVGLYLKARFPLELLWQI